MRGSSFIRSLPAGGDPRSIEARETAVVEAVRSGVALPMAWMPIQSEIPGHRATFYVASDTLRFGEPGPNRDPNDWDWVRIAVTADAAQQIADVLGVLLPTDRIADLAHAQATVRLTPHWQRCVTATTAAMLAHHADIEAERAGRDGLLSTIGKDWILGRELFPAVPGGVPLHPLGWNGAINYGWHTRGPATRTGPYVGQPGVILWQTKGFRHNRRHVDYSQWVPRFVHPRMVVDGRWVATAEVMKSPELAGLVTYDGPLPDTRYPNPLHATDNGGATGRSDQLPNAAEAGALNPFAQPSSDTADPWADITDALARERLRQRAWLKSTWVKDTWFGRFLNLDEPDGGQAGPAPAASSSKSPELRPRPIVLHPEPDTGAPSGVPPGWGPGAALATLLQQIDRRFPYRGRGLLDGVGADEVLRVTDDPSMNGAYRSGPDLVALRAAVLADRRALRTETTIDRVRTRYLAIVARPAPACSHDPSPWDLTRLDLRARPEANATDATDATDTAGSQGEKALQGAKVGAAIGGTVGTALEAVPVFGPLLHLIATGVGAAAGAIAGAVSGAHHDRAFRPTAMQAAAWLALFHIAPSMVFAGLDDITVRSGDRRHPPEEHAARLVRYFLLVSGFVPNRGRLIDPNDMGNENPYMSRIDPHYRLTDPAHLRCIKHLLLARRPVSSEVTTPAQARMILNLLRRTLGPSGIMGWAEARHHRDGLREGVRYVRGLAGEAGPDPYLARFFGGDVTPRWRPHVASHGGHQPAPAHVTGFISETDPFAELRRAGADMPLPGAPPEEMISGLWPPAPPDGADAPRAGAALLASPVPMPASQLLAVPMPGGPRDPSRPDSDASGITATAVRPPRASMVAATLDPFLAVDIVTRSGGEA